MVKYGAQLWWWWWWWWFGGGGVIPNTINSDFQELRRGHIGGSTFHLDNYNKNLKKVKTSGGGGGGGL